MKRTIVTTSLIGLAVAVICYLSVVSQPSLPARFDHEKFVAAAHAYGNELRQQGVVGARERGVGRVDSPWLSQL